MNGETVYVFSIFGTICGVSHTQGEAEDRIRRALESCGVSTFRQAEMDPNVPKEKASFFLDGHGEECAFWGKFEIGEEKQ